jgi:hypothetical protein
MVHKFHKAMGNRDDRYTLEGMMEMDEGYFTLEASKLAHQTQKAGLGSKIKSNVMVMAESTLLEDLKSGKVDNSVDFLWLKY